MITKEQIFAAADAIVAAGGKPRVADVRQKLGSGSFSTINEAMQEWRAAQQEPAAPAKESAPQAIIDRMNALSSDVWREATKLAHEALDQDRAALYEHRAEMEAQQREVVEMADELSDEVETLRELVAVQKENYEKAYAMYTDEHDKALRFEVKLEAAERQIAQQQQEIANNNLLLKSQIDRENEQTKRITDLEVSKAKLEAEVQSQHERNQELKADKQKAEAAAAQAQATASNAQIEAAQLRAELEAMRKQLADQDKLFESLKPAAKPAAKPAKGGQTNEE